MTTIGKKRAVQCPSSRTRRAVHIKQNKETWNKKICHPRVLVPAELQSTPASLNGPEGHEESQTEPMKRVETISAARNLQGSLVGKVKMSRFVLLIVASPRRLGEGFSHVRPVTRPFPDQSRLVLRQISYLLPSHIGSMSCTSPPRGLACPQ